MAGASSIGAVRGVGPMGKAMSIAGMVIGGVLALMLLMNAFTDFPFGGYGGTLSNLGFAVCGAVLAYLGWSAFRDSP